MKPSEPRWVSLPCAGAALRECRFTGNGKDAELRLETEGQPVVKVGCTAIDLLGADGVEARLIALDDVNVEVRWRPREGMKIIVTRAEIDFWLDDREFEATLAAWGREAVWEPRITLATRLAFEIADSCS